MAKAAKGKSVAKVVKGVKPKPLPAKIPVKKPVVKQPIKKVDKGVEKPKAKKVDKVVEKPVEKVQKKVDKLGEDLGFIKNKEAMVEPLKPLEPDIQQAHFTEQEFDQKFVKATFADFKQGQQVFIKDRYGDKWVAKLVDQIGVVSVDSAQFNDLVLRDNAYIKR